MRTSLILTGGTARADVELARRAEAAGFDAAFAIEFMNRHGYVALGAIAETTRRIGFGTAIANAFTRTPLLHASAAMDLDELSGGRMILGLGSGTRRMNEGNCSGFSSTENTRSTGASTTIDLCTSITP